MVRVFVLIGISVALHASVQASWKRTILDMACSLFVASKPALRSYQMQDKLEKMRDLSTDEYSLWIIQFSTCFSFPHVCKSCFWFRSKKE